MAKLLLLTIVLALAGCSSTYQPAPSACNTNPGGYDCQVEMYSKAGGP